MPDTGRSHSAEPTPADARVLSPDEIVHAWAQQETERIFAAPSSERVQSPGEDAVMGDEPPHVLLDLSFPWNEGSPPQCWKCGLPWPSEGTCTGVPNPEQLVTMLDDPETWAQGLATEVRRLHGIGDAE